MRLPVPTSGRPPLAGPAGQACSPASSLHEYPGPAAVVELGCPAGFSARCPELLAGSSSPLQGRSLPRYGPHLRGEWELELWLVVRHRCARVSRVDVHGSWLNLRRQPFRSHSGCEAGGGAQWGRWLCTATEPGIARHLFSPCARIHSRLSCAHAARALAGQSGNCPIDPSRDSALILGGWPAPISGALTPAVPRCGSVCVAPKRALLPDCFMCMVVMCRVAAPDAGPAPRIR